METEDMSHKKLWFKRKLYGWGWYPSSLEGWVVIAIYLGGLLFLFKNVALDISVRHTLYFLTGPVCVLTLLLLGVCFYKGESPRWQWGKTDQSES